MRGRGRGRPPARRTADLPTRLLPPLVEPGTVIGGVQRGRLRRAGRHARGGAGVSRHRIGRRGGRRRAADARSSARAPGRCSARSCRRRSSRAQSRELNFTNEGGVCGTTRLLKNIGGLWLLQACRRSLGRGRAGRSRTTICSSRPRDDRQAFRSLFDPDHRGFFQPPDMPAAIAGYCRQTGQPEPAGPPGYARAILESLAFKYRVVLESLEELTGTRFDDIRIVGGGSRNRLLNQFTADATGRTVLAGPVEATALGNIAMQMLATGTVGSLAEARADHRTLVPGRAVRAGRDRSLGAALRAVSGVRGGDRCLRTTDDVDPACSQDLWDEKEAARLEARPLDLLRYRSNLLGADLRITNFGGGNTSSKFDLTDPLTGEPARVLAVKGSGGDLRSIRNSGFAVLYLDKLERLIDRYRGEAHEDEMVGFYPLCAFGDNRVAASIDTPLHAFLPFDHVDHLHPDWAIALAASANGETKIEEFNARYGRSIIWVPWQRPGFELALMLRRAVEATPDADGLILGSHGLFTWGETQRECYLNSLRTIDQMGEFIHEHQTRAGGRCSAARRSARPSAIAKRRRPRFCRSCAASRRPAGASSATATAPTTR